MTQQTTDRPLVTFALFAYNQEEYIREAVEGAFSQTYDPLEIILSDDCSSDRTFEIMQEMAKEYAGRHQVRVVQTESNMGVTEHVLLRGREARGEIIVLAAGDDISKKKRCAIHAASYNDEPTMAVSGSYDLINENDKLIEANVSQPVAKNALDSQRRFFKELKYPYIVIQGSTASYRKSFFGFKMPPWTIRFSEDNLFNLLIYANGYQVSSTAESLVKYRKHSKAASNHGPVERSAVQAEQSSREAAKKAIQKSEVLLWIVGQTSNSSIVNVDYVEQKAREAKTIDRWPQAGFLERIFSFFSSFISGDLQMTKWKCARLLGRFPHYQPKKIIFHVRGR